MKDEKDDNWVFVCDHCGEEWPYARKTDADEHERRYKHITYQRHKPTHEKEKAKKRKKRTTNSD
jgi:hypothetical protein